MSLDEISWRIQDLDAQARGHFRETRRVQQPASSLDSLHLHSCLSSNMTAITRNLPWFIKDVGVAIVGSVRAFVVL